MTSPLPRVYCLALVVAACDASGAGFRSAQMSLRIADVYAGRYTLDEDVQLGDVIVSSPPFVDPTRTGLLLTVQDDLRAYSGIQLRVPVGTVVPAIGERVSVTGRVQQRFGVTEIEVGAAEQLVAIGGALELPAVPAAEGDGWVSMLVSLKEVDVVDRGLGRRDPGLANGWVLGGTFVELPEVEAGGKFLAVRGILRWEDGEMRLCPRGVFDWVVGPALDGG